MNIESRIELLDDILGSWSAELGADYAGYRNHVYRMVHFCLALRPCSDEERHKIIIAGGFHDIGIWSDRSVDYLPPSLRRARAYLAQQRLEAWSEEIGLMIDEHHKLREYHGDTRYPLVEVFRKADRVDVSLGLLRAGLPRATVAEIRRAFPNAGFHLRLVRLVWQGLRTRPWNPLPFFKW